MPLWSVLMRSWLRVLIVAGFASAAVYAALTLSPARYATTAEIHLPAPATPETIVAAIASLKSQELARKVVADLDLTRLPAFNGAHALHDIVGWLDRISGRYADGAAGQDGKVAAALADSLKVAPGNEAGTLTVGVTARTAELATGIANRLTSHFVAASAESAIEARAHAELQASELTANLAAVEDEIARLKGHTDSNVATQRREDLAEAVRQAERERSDATSRAEAVRALLNKGTVEAIAELQTSPTLHQLIAERVRTEVQKNAAERTSAPDHPRVRDLRARLSELRWQMFREANAIADTLTAEAKAAEGREAEARARLAGAEARASMSASPERQAERLTALERDASAKRAALAQLKAGQQAATSAAHVPAPHVARLLPAEAIAIPAFPRKGEFALLTAVCVLMIGLVSILSRALMAGSRRSIVEAGFADMATNARDRAAVVPEALPQRARPLDVREVAELSTDMGPADILGSADTRLADRGSSDTGKVESIKIDSSRSARAAEPGQFVILSTTADTARHLAGRAMGRKGYRTLLVADRMDGGVEARDLASSLATAGRRAVLVDWSRDGKGIAATLGAPSRPGLNDLLDGRASFDDVIVRLPESDAHFIAAGSSPADPARPLDADWINLVLDALDEAYDHIVVTAQTGEAKVLFETIEGRFDAGIVMTDKRGTGASPQSSTINAGPGVFLGFEVTEIYIVQMDLAQRRGTQRRTKRGRSQAAA